MEHPGARHFRFGMFEADRTSGELSKNGRRIPLQDQPLQVLFLLLERAGMVMRREELQRAVWPADTFVEFDQGLNTAIKKLRLALGDSSDNPRFIETLPRKGYRFIAPVTGQAAVAPVSPQAAPQAAKPTPVPGASILPGRGTGVVLQTRLEWDWGTHGIGARSRPQLNRSVRLERPLQELTTSDDAMLTFERALKSQTPKSSSS